MPYYVYSVRPDELRQLGEHQSFQQAAVAARALRMAQHAQAPQRIRIVFAANPLIAEGLLLQVREAPPDGDD
jgi:hypothetical protein